MTMISQSTLPHEGVDLKHVESTVHRILRDELELEVELDTDIIESGLLDSLAFVQLLVELENEFGVTVELTLLELEDFSTVSNIARLVTARRNGSP